MSAFGPVGPNGQRLEDGSGAPPENVHLIAHQAAVRTQEIASSFAARLDGLRKDALDLSASADDARQRSLAAHKGVLARQAPVPVPPSDMQALKDENAALKAKLASMPPKFGGQVTNVVTSGSGGSGGVKPVPNPVVSSGSVSSGGTMAPNTGLGSMGVVSGGTSSGSV